MEKEKWLIWSNEHAGWWKPARRGYTEKISEAGRYDFEEAEEIVRLANRYHFLQDTIIPNESMLPEDLP